MVGLAVAELCSALGAECDDGKCQKEYILFHFFVLLSLVDKTAVGDRNVNIHSRLDNEKSFESQLVGPSNTDVLVFAVDF